MKKFAPLLIICAGCLWGTMGTFVRYIYAMGLNTMDVLELRCLITATVVVLGVAIYNRSLLKVRLRDLWCFLGTGIISVVLFCYCYFRAVEMMSLSVAATLLYTAPTIVMILSVILFKEELTMRKVVAVILAFCGCLLVSGLLFDTVAISTAGIGFGLASGLAYALYSIFSRYALLRGYHSLTITSYTFIFAALGCLCITRGHGIAGAAGGGVGGLFLAFFFALITAVLPYLLYTLGLSYLENSKASVIASVEPVTATLMGFFVFGEVPTLPMFLGMCLVLSALLALNLPMKRMAPITLSSGEHAS